MNEDKVITALSLIAVWTLVFLCVAMFRIDKLERRLNERDKHR